MRRCACATSLSATSSTTPSQWHNSPCEVPRLRVLCAGACAGCDNACHTYCAGLAEIPEEAWYCAACAGNATPEDPLPLRRSLRHRASAQPSPAAPRRRDRDADQRRHDTPGSVRSTEGQATRRRRAATVSDVAITSPIDLTLSASPEAPRSRRRRLQRMCVRHPLPTLTCHTQCFRAAMIVSLTKCKDDLQCGLYAVGIMAWQCVGVEGRWAGEGARQRQAARPTCLMPCMHEPPIVLPMSLPAPLTGEEPPLVCALLVCALLTLRDSSVMCCVLCSSFVYHDIWHGPPP